MNKTEFTAAVDALIARNIADRTERIAAIDALTECCGDERPDSSQLERLADHILREELTDTDLYKVQRNEYPFLSERQFTTRHNTEVGMKVAEDYGTDGRNYTVPKRRHRNNYENQFVDSRAKSRNKARAAQYRKDTAAGELVAYNLRDTGGELAPEFTASAGLAQRWRDSLSAVYECQ
ncbi:hypothetical protein LOZ80_15060 [Paenibacillus sp. HWE-109]|uniref:hypothetical protein n=1 Tax=Paenibacillus sp. HWE-109 TaxID=1306526 RepID=UPI001EE0F8B6|nr:hypothetical protein [Paenibacillus sp. HWE-109]UKS30180.1 hypothetical protein LOZ80_15060 [Paenibacillus sp. HWE-109]